MSSPPAAASALTQLLLQSTDPQHRLEAERQLEAAGEQNFVGYVVSLAAELSTEGKPDVARQLAGLILKNAISGQDVAIDEKRRGEWEKLDPQVQSEIKSRVLATLRSPCVEAASAACQLVSKLGRIELPRGSWPELMVTMVDMMDSNETNNVWVRTAVVALGYLCEDIVNAYPDAYTEALVEQDRNLIFDLLVRAMRREAEIRLAACKAFSHALPLARELMANESHRDVIFETLIENLQHAVMPVRHAAWECVLQVVNEYYTYLSSHFDQFGELSIAMIKDAVAARDAVGAPSEIEAVALAALEFWSALCDIEVTFDEENKDSAQFIDRSKEYLLPLLFEAMTKQAEVVDMEEWTLSMAAGSCLNLSALVLKEKIYQPALEFINRNITSTDWRQREAAVLAYGSIMEGSSSKTPAPSAEEFTVLIERLDDASPMVRETTAWAFGKIATYHSLSIVRFIGKAQPNVLEALIRRLSDVPRVASYACYAIYEICRNGSRHLFNPKGGATELDNCFVQVYNALIHVARRNDANEANLRSAAFETLTGLIESVTVASQPQMVNVVTELNALLAASCQNNVISEEVSNVQGLICTCIAAAIEKFPPLVEATDLGRITYANFCEVINRNAPPELMHQAAQAETSKGLPADYDTSSASFGCVEEALLAVAALANAMGPAFAESAVPILKITYVGLQRPEETSFCRCCISMVSELSCVLCYDIPAVAHIVNFIIQELLAILQDSTAPMDLKPVVMVALGDLALGMEISFEPYLALFLQLLGQAAATKVEDVPAYAQQEEWTLYIQELKDAVLSAYSAVIHGMRRGNKLAVLDNHVVAWVQFAQLTLNQPTSTESTVAKALELMEDLALAYKFKFSDFMREDVQAKKFNDTELPKLANHKNTTVAARARSLKDTLNCLTRC